ncbi:MAG: hypothetical protein ACREDC_07285 [Bradyrhizobium sp.]
MLEIDEVIARNAPDKPPLESGLAGVLLSARRIEGIYGESE